MSHPVVPWYCIRTLRPSRRDRKPQSASSSSLEDRVTETQNDTPEKWLFIFMMMASPDYSYSWWWLTWLFIFMMMTAPDYSVFIFMKELNTTLELSTSIHIYDFFIRILVCGDNSSGRYLAQPATDCDERSGTQVHQSMSSPSSIENISHCDSLLRSTKRHTESQSTE